MKQREPSQEEIDRQESFFADLSQGVKISELVFAVCLVGIIWLLVHLSLSFELLPK